MMDTYFNYMLGRYGTADFNYYVVRKMNNEFYYRTPAVRNTHQTKWLQ